MILKQILEKLGIMWIGFNLSMKAAVFDQMSNNQLFNKYLAPLN